MFTVYTCCQPFRLLQSVPPNITIFRHEMDSKWTVSKTAKNRPQAVATPSICPCSVLNCSRGNSSWYRFRPSRTLAAKQHSIDAIGGAVCGVCQARKVNNCISHEVLHEDAPKT